MVWSGFSAGGESITYAPAAVSGGPQLRILHYNDVYHVEQGSRDPVGGIARFKTLCDHYHSDGKFQAQPDCLTLFSGDAFNPSLESSVTKGKHMVPALNILSTSAACLGNHDLDFGVEQFEYLASLCTFPWLCTNVLDLRALPKHDWESRSHGPSGEEWLDTINTLPPNLSFIEPSAIAPQLAAQLRREGAEMVIAITHQRQPNDEKLAQSLLPGTVDLILSGHDHYYAHAVINGTHVLRSGTDFKQLSYLEAWRGGAATQGSGWTFRITRRDVLSSIPSNKEAADMVDKITASLRSRLDKPIGFTAAPLDARFTTVRTKESNLGNFVCDLMRMHYNADCCIMAGGTIRGDQVYPPGMLRVKDILDCFPFEDPCVVIGLKGKAVVEALENAVSKYPALEGRFPQVSGITFAFSPSKPPGHCCSEVTVAGSPVQLDREYTLVTRDYMVRGKDGFVSLMLDEHGGHARSILVDETGMLISTLLRQYFMSLKVLGRWKNWSPHLGRHWKGVHEVLHDVHPIREPVEPGEWPELAMKRQKPADDVQPAVGQDQKPVHRVARHAADHAADNDHDGLLDHSDSEDDNSHRADLPAVPSGQGKRERELILTRRYARVWWRKAGMQGHPAMADGR